MEWLLTLTHDPFFEFTIILLLAALLGGIGQLLRQPLIVMFIALGVLVGPSVLDIVRSKENIHLLAEIGIAVLLFIVGLKLDLRIIKSVGKIALMTGLGQVVFTSLFGYFIGLALGFSSLHSFYIAVALTFSSTIIIVKLLSDKKEIDSLHGQIAVGFLIVQDIVVILVMIVLSAMRQQQEMKWIESIGKTLMSGVALLLFTIAMMKWIIPRLSFFLAKSQEMLTLFAIASALTMASVGELMGFSSEVGAFLAGVSLASSQFKDVISSRLVSLRDFLLIFFFVNLGADLNLSVIGNQLVAATVFSVFVLVGNPVIVLIIMGAMGYRKRTSFLAGLTVAQISEFSLIFAGLGLAIGHITEDVLGLITLVGLITIGLSTYLILYSYQIYDFLSPALSIFELKNPYREDGLEHKKIASSDVVIFGLGRFGIRLAELLDNKNTLSYLAVDFDPQIVKAWQERDKNIIYGDVNDSEVLERINLTNAKTVVCTIPDTDAIIHLVNSLKRIHFPGKVYVMVSNEKSFELLKNCGADEVILKHNLAADNFFRSKLL